MEESLLLVAVDGVIRGVEVEDQVLGRLGVSGEELIDQDLGARDQRRAVDAVFEAAEGRGRGEGPLGIGAPSGGHLQHGVGAEGLMVVEVLVAQSEGEDPLGEQRLLVVDGEDGMAWVGDRRVEGVEEADAVGDLAQEQRAGVGGQASPLEVGDDVLGPEGGKAERFGVTVCHSDGLACWRYSETLHYIIQQVRPSHN